MTKILSPYAGPGMPVEKLLPRNDESPELEFKFPAGSDLDLPAAGTMLCEFVVLRETEDKEAGTCTYRVRITGVDKVRKSAAKPFVVKSASEAMKEALDKEEEED